jgi:4-amino-4-deoxy-L-arabinose transferase-like glycosyltransferase
MNRRGDTVLLVAICLAFLAPTMAAIAVGTALGYDEAVYAQLTRHWLTGAPASGWDLHRPPGLSVFGLVPQALFPDAEWAVRLVGAIAGAGVVVAGWWAASTMGGRPAGLIAAVTLAAAAPLQVESASFLTDVPSTLALLALAVVAWRHLGGAAPIGFSFAGLGLLAALAFYLRYGAILEIAGLIVASVFVAPRRLMASWPWVVVALGVFAVALIPHVVVAVAETGTPWGILASASSAAGGGDGVPMITYLAWFPWRLIGPLGAVVALVGIVTSIRASGSADARFVGTAVLVPLLVLGTLVHAEPRYVLFPIVLLVVLGSVEVARHIAHRSRTADLALAGVAVLALVVAAATTATEIRVRGGAFDWKRDAGRDIGAFAGPPKAPDCAILTADVPIMSWYSGCRAVNFLSGSEPDRLALLTGSERFVVLRTDGHLQPPPEAVAELVAGAEVWGAYADGLGQPAAVVYRLVDP